MLRILRYSIYCKYELVVFFSYIVKTHYSRTTFNLKHYDAGKRLWKELFIMKKGYHRFMIFYHNHRFNSWVRDIKNERADKLWF